MNLFGGNLNNPPSGPTVSTAAPDASLGFWRRNQKAIILIVGCLALLIAARAYSGKARAAKREAKADKAAQSHIQDEAETSDAIAALKARFSADEQQREAKEQADLAAAMATHQLTAAQLEALQHGPPLSAPGVTPGASYGPPGQGYYDSSQTARPAKPERPATLVISYREQAEPATKETAGPTSPGAPAFPALPPGYGQTPASPATAAAAADEAREARGRSPEIEKHKANPEDAEHDLAAATGEKYPIREGTWIPCTEELRINGSFASDIDCLVSIPIYTVSGSRLLIPQGTLALGHVAAVNSQNQQRLFVVFDAFIMPDGYTVRYENAAGLDQVGQTGLRDQVNHHYLQMFGASVAIAAVGSLAQVGNFGSSAITAGSQIRSGFSQGMSESATQILNRFSSVLPTFIIREGARNNIHIPFNLWLPDYSKHHMGGDL